MHTESRRAVRSVLCRREFLLPAVLALALLPGLGAERARAQQPMKLPQLWSGRLVAPPGVTPGLTGDQFELKIFRLSSDEEMADLVGALRAGGQTGLRNAMFRLEPKGWARIGKLAAADVVMIRVVDLPDGHRRVRMMTDQPVRLYDKSDAPGADLHPFGFIELLADASATGTGQLVAAASMALSGQELLMESAGTPVVRIIEVTTDSPPAPSAKR